MLHPTEAELQELEELASSLEMPSYANLLTGFPKEAQEELYGFAYHFYGNGKYKEALHFFRVLTVMDCQNRKFWMGFAASLQMLKEYEKALNAYSIAALIDAEEPYVHFHAADCCFFLGFIERGMIALDSAEALAKRDSKHQSLLSQLAVLRQAWLNKSYKKEDQ